MNSLGSGLISGIGSLASSLFGGFLGQKMSKDLMKYQFDLSQQAIDRQNLYNSPAEQIKRLVSAGLSPNLVYGSGVDGNQSSVAQVSQSNRNMDLGNPLGDAVVAYQQQKALEANVQESQSRKALNDAKVLGELNDVRWKDATLDTRIKQASQQLANMVADENYTVTKTNNVQIQRDEILANIDYLSQKSNLTKAQAFTESFRPREVRAHARLMSEQATTNRKQRELYDSIMKLNDAKIDQLGADVQYLLSRKSGQDLENELNKRMQSLGLQGASGKDLLQFVKDVILSFVRGK